MADLKDSRIEKLVEDNYQYWSFQMKMLLQSKDLWEAITEQHPEYPGERPTGPPEGLVERQRVFDLRLEEYIFWREKDQKAMNRIALNVDRANANIIYNMRSGQEAWFALKDRHLASTLGSKLRLKKRLGDIKFAEGKTMHGHLNEMIEMFNKLADIGEQVKEDEKIIHILRSVEPKFSNVTSAIMGWSPERITFAEVRSHLIEEFEKKQEEEKAGDDALAGKQEWRHQPRKCFKCNKIGHYKRQCPEIKMYYSDLRQKLNANKEAGEGEDYLNCIFITELSKRDWLIDSGASRHMTWKRNIFSEIKPYNGNVTVANGEKMKAIGIGTVNLNVRSAEGNYCKIILKETLLVPKISENLISVRKLVEDGSIVSFDKKKVYMKKGGEKRTIGRAEGTQYRTNKDECMETKSKEKENLICKHEWHRRLGHRNLKDIEFMGKHGLPIRNCSCTNECEACIIGKMARKSFPKVGSQANDIMELVVSDVCGQMQTESLHGKRYFITYIDVYSRYCEVRFLRTKDEVADETINFIEKMHNQVGRKLKILRSDKGKEYFNEKLQSYLRRQGIRQESTVGYCPEQNGRAERKNRTLMESARTMLSESKLPKTFWAEAVNTANNTANRIIRRDTGKSPYEMMFGKPPRWEDMKQFGAEAYVMIPKEKRRKLDDKATKMKFVGHDEFSKGFRMTDGRKIIVSREVHFLKTGNIETEKGKETAEAEGDIVGNSEDEQEEDNKEPEVQPEIEAEQSEDEFESAAEESQDEDEQEIIDQTPRRSGRTTQGVLPTRLRDYQVNVAASDEKLEDPTTFSEAINSANADEWTQAMDEELRAMKENETWEMTELPPNRKAIGSKWVFKTKYDDDGNVIKRKARLVAQGFSQKHGVDYLDVFAPVARGTTVRMLLSTAGREKWKVKQYDVKTAFLNGKLEEEIFMKPPPGQNYNGKMCKLQKSLYGLKQAARVWNQLVHESLVKYGCQQNETDNCLYSMTSGGEIVHLLIHVDDILAATNNEAFLDELMAKVGSEFELKCMGEAKEYLGIELTRDTDGNFHIGQKKFIKSIVKEAKLEDAKSSNLPMDTGYHKLDGKLLDSNEEYRKLVGMLLYLSTNSRPDISACVAILSQRVISPRTLDMNEVKRLIRYLKETQNVKLQLSDVNKEKELQVISDANWGEDRLDRKSTSGYYITINGGAIAWCSKKQSVTALSSAEAEYVALAEAVKEGIWISKVFEQFDGKQNSPMKVFTDSQSAVAMVKNQNCSKNTKHIDIKYHFTRDLKEKGIIDLIYVPTEHNIADMMTKPLGATRLRKLREQGGLKDDETDKH